MAEDWTYDITQVKTTEIKEPLGYNSSEINVEDSKSRRQEINRMKENKAWGLVTGQGRSIFTTFISSFFIIFHLNNFHLNTHTSEPKLSVFFDPDNVHF